MLRHRGITVVEPSEDRCFGTDTQRPIAEETRRREVATAWGAERSEHRMAVIDEAQRTAATVTIGRSVNRSGQQIEVVAGPAHAFTQRNPQATAGLDEPGDGRTDRPVGEPDVIQHHDPGRRHISGRDLVDRSLGDGERGARSNRQSLSHIQIALCARGARFTDNQHRHDVARRDGEVVHVVLRQPVRGGPHRDRHRRVLERERVEGHRGRAIRLYRDSQRLQFAAVQLERHEQAFDRLVPTVSQPRRHRGSLALRKQIALHRSAGHADIRGRVVVGHRDRCQHGAGRQENAAGTVDPHTLKIADEHDLEQGLVRVFENPLGQLQGGTVSRGPGAQLDVIDRRQQTRAIRGRPCARFGSTVEKDDRGLVVRSQITHHPAGDVSRLLPATTVAHAVGTVDQHHDLARAAGHRRQRGRTEEGTRERRDEQHQGGASHEQ